MTRDAYNNVLSSLVLCVSCFFLWRCAERARSWGCLYFGILGCATLALELPRALQQSRCCSKEHHDSDSEFPSAAPAGLCGLRWMRPRPQVRAGAYAGLVLVLLALSEQLDAVEIGVTAVLLAERAGFYTLLWRQERSLYKGLDHPEAVYDHLDTFSVELTPMELQGLDPDSPGSKRDSTSPRHKMFDSDAYDL
eukprot:TRINITY_DN17110_c0_g1_i1.p1 TRINITY_DN17110_c0_g1~~TRINITY_DN17110_c0_g1_i1.p1  ORF type:complete len:194 (-),score=43.70 TRINITY_DN17110_c0_g1_i1:208-789(-)